MKPKKEKAKPEPRQYTKHFADLNRSPSWRNMPLHALRVVYAVIDAHNRKGGKENGLLVVPYKTLGDWLGTTDKTAIALAIDQAVALGTLAVARGYVAKDGTKVPNLFRATWLPGHNGGPPTNEWKTITSEQAKEIVAKLKKEKRKRGQSEWFKNNRGKSVCEPAGTNSSKPPIVSSTTPPSPTSSIPDPTHGPH